MREFITKVFGSVRREPFWFFAALIIVGGTWGFIELADEVIEGDTQSFDESVIRMLRNRDDLATPIGPRWLMEVGRDITGLGGIFVLAMVTTAVSGFLYLRRGHRMMILLLAATISGLIASLLLKNAFSRPRPDFVPHLSEVYTSSFPSGHSMMSAVVYLTLASIIASTLTERKLKLYVFSLAVLVTILVGCSRVYMGVHYPTDVLAGWTAGIIWSWLIWSITRYLQRHHSVEQPADPAELKNAE